MGKLSKARKIVQTWKKFLALKVFLASLAFLWENVDGGKRGLKMGLFKKFLKIFLQGLNGYGFILSL